VANTGTTKETANCSHPSTMARNALVRRELLLSSQSKDCPLSLSPSPDAEPSATPPALAGGTSSSSGLWSRETTSRIVHAGCDHLSLSCFERAISLTVTGFSTAFPPTPQFSHLTYSHIASPSIQRIPSFQTPTRHVVKPR
jgi:hypothetical protein